MKTKTTLKFLFFICFITNLSISFSVFGQLKHFLPDSNAYISVSPYKFWFMGDTIICSKQYKKVYVQSYDSIPDFSQAIYFAAVREDTLNEKIYCLQKLDSVDRLIADFALQAGDTITVYAYWWILNLSQPTPYPKTSTVLTVDSILINDNYHKRINIDEGHEWGAPYSESWIEGIGSTWGLFFPNVQINISTIEPPKLLCVHIEDTIFYQNPYFTTCYLHDFFVEIEEIDKTEIVIFPTLAEDLLNIKIKPEYNNEKFEYQIFDIHGRVLLKNILISSVINISELPNGFYLISFRNVDNKIITNYKFIKN